MSHGRRYVFPSRGKGFPRKWVREGILAPAKKGFSHQQQASKERIRAPATSQQGKETRTSTEGQHWLKTNATARRVIEKQCHNAERAIWAVDWLTRLDAVSNLRNAEKLTNPHTAPGPSQ